MTQYVAFAPDVEVNGATVLSITAGMGPASKPILAAHGFDNVKPDAWYSQQAWLDTFHEISQLPSNESDLVSIGMEIPDNAMFPPDIDSIVAALQSIDVAYHMNHRGGEIGHYTATVVNDHQVDVVCDNPYPCDFDYGIIFSMARRFCPNGMFAHIEHDEDCPCRKNSADSCTYHVTWAKK